MCARFGPPEPVRNRGGIYPWWRWGVIWSDRAREGIEWTLGVDQRVVFHLMLAKGGSYTNGIAFRVVLWRLCSLFALVRLPWTPDPFEVLVFTNPPIFYVGRGAGLLACDGRNMLKDKAMRACLAILLTAVGIWLALLGLTYLAEWLR